MWILKENHANVLLRGIRSVHDYDYEAQLTGMYGALMPELEVVFLNTKAEVSFISSTFVREIVIHKGDVTPFVQKILQTISDHTNFDTSGSNMLFAAPEHNLGY